jgi:signal transduction histidine kinase
MKTPLNAIINLLKCIEPGINIFLKDRYLKPTIVCSKLLLNLVHDMLDIAQMSNLKIRIIQNKFNLRKLAEKTL